MSDHVHVLPRTKLFLRSKQGLDSLVGPDLSSKDIETPTSVSFERDEFFPQRKGVQFSPVFSSDGVLMCLVQESGHPLLVINSDDGSLVGEIPCLDAQSVEWSPSSTYLITWSRAVKTVAGNESEGNLRIWSTASLSLVGSFHQRVFRKDLIQWSADESLCLRMVTNEVHVSDGTDLSRGIINKVYVKGVTQFKASPTAPSIAIASFTPETGGNPAKCALFRLASPSAEPEGPLASRTMFSASEANMMWNKQGTAVLVHTQSDVDSSNLSYYGSTGLFLLSVDGSTSAAVPQTKDGPIHDVAWSPLGDVFVVCAGHMPCACSLYNTKGEPVFEFGIAHRNTISWSPHGRFLVLAGFGNLAGEMDFYDMLRRKRIGTNASHCAVTSGWSPCSRLFMTATLAPRMNVDNGVKLFTCEGSGPVFDLRRDACYDAIWRPALPARFPDRGPNRKPTTGFEGGPAVAAPAPAKPAAYRAPGSSGTLAGLIQRDRENGGGSSVFGPGSGSSAGSKKRSPEKAVRTIPGMPPPPPPTTEVSKSKAKKDKKAANAAAANAAAAAAAVPPSPGVTVVAPGAIGIPSTKPAPPSKAPVSASAAAPVSAVPPEPMDAAERDKRVKAAKKKLKSVSDLRTRLDADRTIRANADQLAKLASEETLLRELKELESATVV